MRLFLFSILLFASQCIHSQYAYLVSSNELIIGPDEVVELSSPLVDFYFENYSDMHKEIEAQFHSSFGSENEDELRLDTETLEDILSLWTDLKNKDSNREFIDQYDSANCYEIKASNGDTITEYDVVQAKDQSAILSHVIKLKVKVLPKKGQWVRKRKPNCVSSNNPDDCFVACYENSGGEFVLESGRDELIMAMQPNNFDFDEEERTLSFNIELQEEQYIVDLETGQRFIVLEWTEQECK